MPINVTTRREEVEVEVKKKKKKIVRYFATVNTDPEFLVGTQVNYTKKITRTGLSLVQDIGGVYDRNFYRTQPATGPQYGFWADFIFPTVQCESRGHFRWLNTYDRAWFTFGFLQFSALDPRGYFVQFFRALLKTPEGKEYFPDLVLNAKGFITRVLPDGKQVQLETSSDTNLLRQYLNPTRLAIEEREEVERAARFIHWSDTHATHRDLQVKIGIENVKKKMAHYDKLYSLDGVMDKVCLVIMDIHHQGRAKTPGIVKKALDDGATPEADFANLLDIGRTSYPERIKTLEKTIAALTGNKPDQPFGKFKYDSKKNDFVPI